MVNWMVAIDEGADSVKALNDALFMMNKAKDKIFLLAVVEDVAYRYTFTVSSAPILVDAQRHIEKSARNRLQRLGKKCLEHGYKAEALIASAAHVGDMICRAVEQKSIDVLVLGRRGMGKFERMIVGSTSKYCLEHASCNVFIAKSLIPAAEIHASKEQVVQLEETERQRRIQEEKLLDEKLMKDRETNKLLTKQSEEQERAFRLKDPSEKEREQKAHQFASQISGSLLSKSMDMQKTLSGRWFIGDIPIEEFVGETQS